MKYIFSLLILFSFNLQASVINIFHQKNIKEAKVIKSIFIKKYSIPSNMISINESSCTIKTDNRFLNLCITKKGELIQLSSNIYFLRKSLKSFSTP